MAGVDASPEARLDTPVLFLVFNRPDTTQRVFEAIAAARPRRLYVAADGPRTDRPGEAQRCAETRAIAASPDWPCEVKTLFREENLGCRSAVSSALDWFFDAEAEGIVLEDDCLPAPAFFEYCSVLLERYRDDERVLALSGDNFQPASFEPVESYYFSRYNHVWGWASWRRAWRLFERDMAAWPRFRDEGRLEGQAPGDEAFRQYWTSIFDRVAAGAIDSWAYPWLLTSWIHGGLACLPSSNLVSNIGADEGATHTRKADGWALDRALGSLTFPLRHPPTVERDVAADRFTDRRVYRIGAPRRSKQPLLGSVTLRRIVEELRFSMRRLFTPADKS